MKVCHIALYIGVSLDFMHYKEDVVTFSCRSITILFDVHHNWFILPEYVVAIDYKSGVISM